MLLALLKNARLYYVCPSSPPTTDEASVRWSAYLRSIPAAAFGDIAHGTEELAEVLWLLTAAVDAGSSNYESASELSSLAQRLAGPACKRRLQRQLEQLPGIEGQSECQQQQLLTVEQLQYTCHKFVAVFAAHTQQPAGEQLAVLPAGVTASAQVMCQLEPNNPASHALAAGALYLCLAGDTRQAKQMAECYLRAFDLAKQRGSDFWTVFSASAALTCAASDPVGVGQSLFAAALAAFSLPAMEAALRRCKRLLAAGCWLWKTGSTWPAACCPGRTNSCGWCRGGCAAAPLPALR